MRLRELISEGYREAEAKFVSQGADPLQVTQSLDQFRDLVNRNQVQDQQRNIDWWAKNHSYSQFSQFLQQKSLDTSKTQLKKSKDAGQSVNLLETSQWLVVIPLDKDASCFHGRHSDWCTTKRTQRHYEEYFYDKHIILIYCLNKQTGGMWAIANYRHIGLDDEDADASEYDLALLEKNSWAELFDQRDQALTLEQFQQQTGLDPIKLLDLSDQHMSRDGQVSKRLHDRRHQLTQANKKLQNVGGNHRDLDLEQQLITVGDAGAALNYVSKLGEAGRNVSDLPRKLLLLAMLKYSIVPIITWIPKPDRKLIDLSLENQPNSVLVLLDRNQATPEMLATIPLSRFNTTLIEKLREKKLFSDDIRNKLAGNFHGIYQLHKAGLPVDPHEVEKAVLSRTQYAKGVIVNDTAHAMKTFKFIPDPEFFEQAAEINDTSEQQFRRDLLLEIEKFKRREVVDLTNLNHDIGRKTDTLKIYQTKINEYQTALQNINSKPQLSTYDQLELKHIRRDLDTYQELLQDFQTSIERNNENTQSISDTIKEWDNVITQLTSSIS